MAIRLPVLTVIAAALVAAVPVAAQDGRLSLAERVARLEQQQQAPAQPAAGGGMELLGRLQELQTELQALRNLAEQQAFEIEELKKRQRDQYVDLDSRIEALRGGAPAPSGGLDLDAGAPAAAAPAIPAPPADPNQLQMQDADPVDPYTGEPIPRADPLGAAPAPAMPAADPMADPATDYQVAFDALKQGRYDESATLFRQFLDTYPGHELADNAQYWLGESYYVTQSYETALATFRSLIERHPGGEKTADAQLKLGYCYYELGRYAESEAALQQVIQQYPDTTVARLAQSRLRALALEQR